MPHALCSTSDPLLSAQVFAPPPQKDTGRGPLHPGAVFCGVQRSGRNSYEVRVQIDTVNVSEGRLCGTLEIKGLTSELPSLSTFFEGEIVGEEGLPGFKTSRYGATEVDDMKHWARFPSFTRHQLAKELVQPHLNLKNAKNRPFLFMRWKERFVVPNRRVEAIHGASYAGFYYVCLDCEPSHLPSDSSISPHRGISPAPRLARRQSSTARSPSALRGDGNSGLVTQSRTPPAHSSGSSTASVNLSSPTSTPTTPPPPAPARRSSSGSYADALRADNPSASPRSFMDFSSPSSSPSLASPSSFATPNSTSSSSSAPSTSPTPPPTELPSTSPTPPPTELPTPKLEVDSSSSVFATVFDEASSIASSSASSSSQAPQLPPVAISSPFVSSDSSLTDWPASSSTLPTSSSSTSPFSTTSSPAPRRQPALLRRMSSDVATVVAKARGRSTHQRRGSIREETLAGEEEEDEEEDEEEEVSDDRGLRSWTEATISGFYFHHSASPYQELSLRYVPTTRGGSSEFSFR